MDYPITTKHLIEQHMRILKGLQYESGLFAASKKEVNTGYDKAWLRDNFYECLAFEILKDWETVRKTYRAILDIFLKHESKIDWAIRKKKMAKHEYIHPRYNPHNFDEFWEEWGTKQHDSIGCILFKIGELEDRGIKMIEDENDRRIVQKLVDYLAAIEYWHDPDSGVWEEDEEIHASSLGACIAGLQEISKRPGISVEQELIERGKRALEHLLPRESKRKFVDLALLTLIYPYHLTTPAQTKTILQNVEYHLTRNKGVIRYKNDHYYNRNPDGYSEEAEWTFGFSYLAIIYKELKDDAKAEYYIKKCLETISSKGEVPELYYSHSDEYNSNSPLGWSESLLVVALFLVNEGHLNNRIPRVPMPEHLERAETRH